MTGDVLGRAVGRRLVVRVRGGVLAASMDGALVVVAVLSLGLVRLVALVAADVPEDSQRRSDRR
jgi:hypothetical protein